MSRRTASTLTTGGTLFVQNSGAGRHFATGPISAASPSAPGGLAIRLDRRPPATVTAFGRRLNADGSFTTGDDFFFAVDFQAGGGGARDGYTRRVDASTPASSSPASARRRLPADAGAGGPDPTTGPTGGSDSIPLPPGADGDDLVDTSFAAEPLIEEPVTSGGESSLVGDDCDRDDDGDCDEGGQ